MFEEPYAGKLHVRFCEGCQASLSRNFQGLERSVEIAYSTKIEMSPEEETHAKELIRKLLREALPELEL